MNTNINFYGLATTKQGTSVVIKNLPDYQLGAVNAAKQHCAKEGLIFDRVIPNNSQVKGGSTLTKEKKARDVKANASKKR